MKWRIGVSLVLTISIVLLLLAGCGSDKVKGKKTVSTTGTAGVWVTNSDIAKPVLYRIDPATNQIVATIGLNSLSKGMAVAGSSIWLSDYGGDKVVRVDAVTNKIVATVKVGKAPGAVTVGHGSIWVANSNEGSVSRIDPATNKVISTIKVTNSLLTGICVFDNAVWVASTNMIVSRLDPSNNTVTGTIGVRANPTGIAGGFGSLWVGDPMGKKVLRLDPAAAKVATTIQTGNTHNILVADGVVAASNSAEGNVVFIDPQDNKVVNQVEVGKNLGSLAFGYGSVWAVNTKNNMIYRIDTISKVTTPISVEKPGKIAITQ